MLVVLLAILVALILIFCGDRGAKSIVTTAIHAGILIVAIFCMYRGLPPVLVTAGACLMISAVTMFYQNDGDLKSRIAFGSVVIVILVLIPVVFWFAGAANAEGFNSEQYEITDTNGYTRNIDMNMLQLQISVMLIALIGTVIDIAIAITSSIYEIYESVGGQPDGEVALGVDGQLGGESFDVGNAGGGARLTYGQLLSTGFTASRAILNTSIHTIFYIYIAEYLTLMIQYVNEYDFARLINSQSFAAEFISISISGIGCCLVVPVATMLTAWVLGRGDR